MTRGRAECTGSGMDSTTRLSGRERRRIRLYDCRRHCIQTLAIETLIGAVVLAVSLVLLWSGRQHLDFDSFQTTLLSILEIVGVVVSVVGLGWVGVGIFVLANVLATLTWSVILAVRKQSVLVGAAVRSTSMTREDADALWHWMNRHGAFGVLRPIERAELIRTLAGQARTPDEIQPMSIAVAQLSVIFECEAVWLAPRFDQLLRLYGKSAADSEEVADTLTSATKNSATTFKEMLEAMIIAGGGSPRSTGNEAVIGRRAA